MKRLLVIMLFAIAGCAQVRPPEPPLPVYPAMDAQAALEILQNNARKIHTVVGRCNLVLTRENGESVQLDGAVALATPDRLRLRAWKMGQAVFDLTLRPDGVWIETPDDPSAKQRILPAMNNTARLGQELLEFTGGFFESAGVESTSADAFIYQRGSLFCRVDRRTLSATRYWVVDDAGKTRFSLDLSDYRIEQGILWPGEMTAIEDGGNKIEIQFDDLEINTPLAPGAFVPPRRSEKRS